jgi:hypothetical protein
MFGGDTMKRPFPSSLIRFQQKQDTLSYIFGGNRTRNFLPHQLMARGACVTVLITFLFAMAV